MALADYRKSTFSGMMNQGLHIDEEKPSSRNQNKIEKKEKMTKVSVKEESKAEKTEELTEEKSEPVLIKDIFRAKKKPKPKKSSRTFYIEDSLYEKFVEQAAENDLSPSEALSMVLERVLS
ncbi:MAG: hypothetical protein IJS35_06975 [Firmicutes bacterium]|nr:hypothetical protein [Bacillota bacterium]